MLNNKRSLVKMIVAITVVTGTQFGVSNLAYADDAVLPDKPAQSESKDVQDVSKSENIIKDKVSNNSEAKDTEALKDSTEPVKDTSKDMETKDSIGLKYTTSSEEIKDSKESKDNNKNATVENKDADSEDTSKEDVEIDDATRSQHEELNYAIEEMKEAASLYDDSDLSNQENYERMIRFATASLDRVRGLNIPESSDSYCHVQWIEETGDQIRNDSYRIDRLIKAIGNVKTVFAEDRNDTIENKNAVLDGLNQIITEERQEDLLNRATLAGATTLLHEYANQIPDEPENPSEDELIEKNQNALTEKQHEQLNYAIEEMKEAATLHDNSDLTNQYNYERMIRFATASLDRVRGLNITEGTEAYNHVQWIEETGDQIRNASYRINDLNSAIKNLKDVFSKGNFDEKNEALEKLNDVIVKEVQDNVLNRPTLMSAVNTLHQYAGVLPETPDEDVVIPSNPEPEVKPEEKPEVKPEEKPEEKPEVKPEEKPEVKPEEDLVEIPSDNDVKDESIKNEANSEDNKVANNDLKVENKQLSKDSTKKEDNSEKDKNKESEEISSLTNKSMENNKSEEKSSENYSVLPKTGGVTGITFMGMILAAFGAILRRK